MRQPNFREPGLNRFLTDMDKEIQDVKRQSLSITTANHSVLLMAPNKKIYEVTVSDVGALVVTLVQG